MFEVLYDPLREGGTNCRGIAIDGRGDGGDGVGSMRFCNWDFFQARCKFLTKHQGEWEKVDPRRPAKPDLFPSGSSSSQIGLETAEKRGETWLVRRLPDCAIG
jgi:hypothetical protein